MFWSSHPEVLCKKNVLKNVAKFRENQVQQNWFLVKLKVDEKTFPGPWKKASSNGCGFFIT